jgi:hypothetical protein
MLGKVCYVVLKAYFDWPLKLVDKNRQINGKPFYHNIVGENVVF